MDADEPGQQEGGASKGRSVFAIVRSLAGLTLVSRLLGFVRDVLMAVALGTGLAADAFFLAWTIPNLFRRLFGEGAFATALVPVFVEAREAGDDEGARALVSAATTRLALGLSLLVLWLVGLFTLGLGPGGEQVAERLTLSPLAQEKLRLVLDLGRLLVPYLLLICVAGLLGGALNALDRFVVPAVAPVVLNAVWIVALLIGRATLDEGLPRVRFLAVGILVGGVLQLFLHTNAMKRAGFPVRPTLHADPERLRRVRSLFLSLALGLALFQLNALLDSLIAYTLVPTGGVSALYYANRLTQLPIGVLGVALATAVFPELARRAKRGDSEGLGEILDRGVALGAFVALPAACGLAALAEPLVSALFERGAFSSESTQRTARVLLCLTPAVVTACVTPVITRAFYAEEEVKTPVRVGVVCVLVNLTLNLLLVGPLAEAGLALATSASQILNLVLQVAIYRRRRLARGERPATGRTLKSVVQSALLAGVMGVLAWATQRYLPGPELLRVLVAIGTGVAVYAGGAYALRLEPLRLLLARRG